MKEGQRPLSLVVICGPTAGGKTSLALDLAEHFGVEIVSADSRQVYRGMDIGTAKASVEERAKVRHHLIDVVDPNENFTASDFIVYGRVALNDIADRSHLPLVVGGTGFYVDALLRGLVDAPGADPALRQELADWELQHGSGSLHTRLQAVDPVMAARLTPLDQVRIIRALEVYYQSGQRLSDLQGRHAAVKSPYRVLSIGLASQRDLLYDRINQRVDEMIQAGLLNEVQALLEQGYNPDLKALKTIGYQECVNHLLGNASLPDTISLIQRNSRRYAKRQLTWFRKNKDIIWLDSPREFAKVLKLIDHFIMSK
ncbi:tRNA (adenosine(37)-N6)-dimethylallyltransferase MiaA [Syntrophotalea acetylenivorans]|uniref:tRNA dimethylallyltransferase n=1 Tax=Syntrophotalea acetylenivorans TaxID=1842532 RepID=A0A1L3GSY0_9BACT|nr:tRNA (adenosine(37)-N6)-dimethylallyltransferase MiaA [Syntrophotalea acetylenivorans]APG28970.1 tRNA (adenosine(37)-N6)-dimethylallyltransferase MiaA [Syntrophotalea acetylenivorans]